MACVSGLPPAARKAAAFWGLSAGSADFGPSSVPAAPPPADALPVGPVPVEPGPIEPGPAGPAPVAAGGFTSAISAGWCALKAA
ncbi:hypothetical protein CVO96_12190 [Deinococcus koreensis]|uniref:Uncharacterized protein n=1 Tax=Deinococcus koreensis TaxID=2054903 RepID=A0A2K3UZQ9_9DEIO|nr:hypothetical protein CVO96_12190 [Deinococcus koreensis]